jgi:ATP-binding cassette subfamily C (CFTR/MRP) protein 1
LGSLLLWLIFTEAHLLKLADNVIIIREGKVVQQRRDTTQAKIMMEHALHTTEYSGPVPGSNRHRDNNAEGTASTVDDSPADEQDLSRRTGDTQVYTYYAKSVGWSLSAAYFLTHATVIFCMKFPDIWLKWWSEAEVAHPGQRTWLYVGVNVGFALFAVLCVVAMLLILYIFVVPRASSRIHKRLLDTVMVAPYAFFARTAAGVTLNRYFYERTSLSSHH